MMAYIANNFITLKEEIGNSVREQVKTALAIVLGEDFKIFDGEKIQNENAQLWIKYTAYPDSKLYYGVESFSYNATSGLYVGILNEEKTKTKYELEGTTVSESILWPYWQKIESYGDHDFDFDGENTLYKLFTDESFKLKFITHIINEVQKFIFIHKSSLLSFLTGK